MPLTLRVLLSLLTRPARHRYGPRRSQVADLHVPKGDGPFPVAVVLHGGYWRARYGKITTRPLSTDLTRRGWAAWNVEYRRLGRDGGGWPATFDDVAAAVDHLTLLDDPRLDLGRAVAVGHSAGGQLALWVAGRPGLPEGAPGAAPRVPVTQVIGLAPVTDMVRAGDPAHELLGGTPDEEPDRWAQADPLRRVPLGVPVVLVHPVDDETVPVQRSREYAASARSAGGTIELVEPATGGHRGPIDPSDGAWRAAAELLVSGDGAG